MATWTYRTDKIYSFRKTENGSVVIKLGEHKMPLVHVDRFNLLLGVRNSEDGKLTKLVIHCSRKTPKSNWILDVFKDGERLRKDARATYGLESPSLSNVMRLAKSINPEMRVNISED